MENDDRNKNYEKNKCFNQSYSWLFEERLFFSQILFFWKIVNVQDCILK